MFYSKCIIINPPRKFNFNLVEKEFYLGNYGLLPFDPKDTRCDSCGAKMISYDYVIDFDEKYECKYFVYYLKFDHGSKCKLTKNLYGEYFKQPDHIGPFIIVKVDSRLICNKTARNRPKRLTYDFAEKISGIVDCKESDMRYIWNKIIDAEHKLYLENRDKQAWDAGIIYWLNYRFWRILGFEG